MDEKTEGQTDKSFVMKEDEKRRTNRQMNVKRDG
jgi:hypothetical protein